MLAPSAEAFMDRVQFIQHNGKYVLLIDYSGVTDEAEMLKIVAVRRELVSAQRPASVLTLTDITGARYSKQVLAKVKEAAVLDRPFVRRAALVGVDEGNRQVLEAVSTFAVRTWRQFDTRQQALDWLVEESKSADKAKPTNGKADVRAS